MKTAIVLFVLLASCMAQRPSFAGSKPIGYPVVETTPSDALSNRFGDDESTTLKLPLEALGDAALVDRLLRLPIDQQPFWLLNWRALEENRNNPQNYPQRGNSFTESPTKTTR